MSCRCRPLHTCGVSILEVAHITYEKAQGFDGPVGSTTRKVAKLAGFVRPLVYVMLYQWLAILFFADDCILTVENFVEKMFPSSAFVFNGVDYLVQLIGSFPERFNEALDKASMNGHRVSLDSALVQGVFFWLHSFITTMINWASGSAKEKDIMVDTEEGNDVDEAQQPAEAKENLDSDDKTPKPEAEKAGKIDDSGAKNGTFEKGTEKGAKGDMGKKSREEKDEKKEKAEKTNAGKEESVKEEENADKSDKDTILELFESGWLMFPGKAEKGSSRRRSGSDTVK